MNSKVAIIGMSCRFPGGVGGPDEFWKLLESEKDAITHIPTERFGTEFYQHPSKREPGKAYTFAAGVLDDVAGFDAAFFGISPREAAQMDPQQRLLIELTWEAFEEAGVRPRDLRGRACAVFVGVAGSDYGNRSMDDLSSVDPYSATGNTLSIASNRISYLFDLRGPSMSVDTACSSSLVALHQAVGSLQAGEAEMALVGGVNLLLHPYGFVGFSKASMLSPRGRCRAFDATGDGYVRAEGGAIVVLKPLERALADGDTIHAVIAGTGVNSDGYSQGGISVPGAVTQAALLRDVYARAEIDPRSVDYLEAHGTGTAVGDPIEARALIEVMGAGRPASQPLLIGSVKTNIGHLETASGMAGLIKAVLCLKHRAVPRSLHFDVPNPNIDFEGGRLRVVDRCTTLAEDGRPLVVGVNSFGFGGTNAHVVLTEAPVERSLPKAQPAARIAVTGPFAPLVLTARSRKAVSVLAAHYLHRLASGTPWQTLAAGAAHGRQWLETRAVVAPATMEEAYDGLAALAARAEDALPSAVVEGQVVQDDAPVTLLFSGNGSQWPMMGKQLFEQDAVFRAAVGEVDALWCADGSDSLLAVLEMGVDADMVATTEHGQPLLFAIQVGIVRVLDAHGIAYDACAGHSVGEVAAAWAAGALSLADAVRVVKVRSRAQAVTRGTGRMAAVGIGEERASELIAQLGLAVDVDVAGINSPQSVTLAGSLAGLEALQAAVQSDGVFFQLLDLDYAFHSHRMDGIEPMVRAGLAGLEPVDGTRRFVSTVTGAPLEGSALDAAYWWRNIREPVRFGDAIAQLARGGSRLFIEVGPHSILRTYVKQTLAALGITGMTLATLKRQHDSAAMLQRALFSALAHGAQVDAACLVAHASSDVASVLPRYPWQHERYWLAPTIEGYDLVNRRRVHPLLGYRLHEHPFAWENQIDPMRLPYLSDHVVDGGITFPAAGFVEMALAAARMFFGTDSCALENLEIRQPVVFQAQHSKVFRLIVDPGTAAFTIETRDRMSDDAWSVNVVGRLLASGNTLDAHSVIHVQTLHTLAARPVIDAQTLYASTESIGLAYGPAFRRVVGVRAAGERALAELSHPLHGDDASAYCLHPALMDSGFHPLFALMVEHASPGAPGDHAAWLPVQVGRVDYSRGDTIRQVLAVVERRSPHSVVASFQFLDASAQVVARLANCRFRRVDLLARRYSAPARYVYRLEARPWPGAFDASSLPETAKLVDAASAALDEQAERDGDAGRRTFHLTEMLPLLDVLASGYALRAFEEIGVFDMPTLPQGEHAALVERLAQMLIEDGLAVRDGGRLLRDATACEALPPLDELWRTLLEQSPAHVAELTLLAHCGAALPALLSGELTAQQVMTPTSRSLVEHFFEASPTWSRTHAQIGECVARALDVWREPRPLRVLEMGDPRADVLRPLGLTLPGSRVVHMLACTAQQRAALVADTAGGAQVARIMTLSVSPTFTLQVDDGAPYDVLVANRFLDGAHDPLAVMQALREWLAPGALVAIAQTRRSRFTEIVFGLSPDAPQSTLAPAALVALLEQAGYTDVVSYAEQDLELEGTPALVFARAPQREVSAGDVLATADSVKSRPPWLLVQPDAPDGAFAVAAAGAFDAVELANVLRGRDCEAEVVPLSQAVRRVAAGSVVPHLVFFAPDRALPAQADGECVMFAQQTLAVALARLVRDLSVAGVLAKITVVTHGGAPFAHVPNNMIADAMLRPEQATLWGLVRVLANEHPELEVRLVDLSPACAARAELLAQELLAGDVEEEVVHTPRGRFVPRMLDVSKVNETAREGGTVLAFETPGSLRNLEWFAQAEHPLADDEIELEPVATGLNFRDVMYAMGLLSDEAVETGFAGATIGMELSGRVMRVGSAVQSLQPGDAVLGFAPASFAARVRTRASALVRKPARLTFEEAATIPTTFFTAYYALFELARLRRGERVLVHGAAGGVGIAAIQLARHVGTEVFATAGSREKREFVRLLGADHVFDSRSLAFADRIRERTGGAGVDVVLNSLAGEAMVRSIDTLRPFGRFLELGKRDFYENSRIGLRPFRNNISYFGIDADQLMGALPELTARLFAEMMRLFEEGVLHPLPYRQFPAARVEEAFRYMQQARQIGKVLVNYPAGTPAPARGVETEPWRLDAGAAYLIVGGASGLGFATARRMVERGARHLTLASRRGKLDEATAAEVERWLDVYGVQVRLVACDVTHAPAVHALIASIQAQGTPLKGVLHSAMHIDDGLVRNLDDARFTAVLAPKVAGVWNLHVATRGCPLDFFVVYSSATTALGNPGQSSYVAANSFLEALIERRRAAGDCGTFMAWGPLDDVGFLARNDKTREALQTRIGGVSISSNEALAALEHVLAADCAGEIVVRLDWPTLSRGMPAANARRYAEMSQRSGDESSLERGEPLRERVQALPRAEALALVEDTLRAQIARILHLAPERVALDTSVLDMGMDSLMGMELGMAVEEAFAVKLSVMVIAEGTTVHALATRIVDSIETSNAGGTAGRDAQQAPTLLLAQFASKHVLEGDISVLLAPQEVNAPEVLH